MLQTNPGAPISKAAKILRNAEERGEDSREAEPRLSAVQRNKAPRLKLPLIKDLEGFGHASKESLLNTHVYSETFSESLLIC